MHQALDGVRKELRLVLTLGSLRMRLIARNIHRAFPELDRFTDAQCHVYVGRVRAAVSYQLSVVCGFLLGAAIGIVPGIAVVSALNGLPRAVRHSDTLGLVIVIMSIGAGLGIPSICGLLARDLVLRAFLRHTIGLARCPACRYSLLGQRVTDRKLRCPECGAQTTLDDLGLDSEESLNPRVEVP